MFKPSFSRPDDIRELQASRGGSKILIRITHLTKYFHYLYKWVVASMTSKKLPNVYKSCPRMISLEKLNILTPLQKLPKNVGDLGKLIGTKGIEKLPNVQ